MKKSKTMLVAFISPALIIFLMVFIFPIVRTVIMSFYHVENVTSRISEWTPVGFDNYIKLYNTDLFKISMYNIFRIWCFGGIIVMSLSLLFATFLNSGIYGKKFFRAVIYMPNIISAVALATMWLQYVYNPRFGLFKNIFTTLNIKFLANINWTSPDFMFTSLLIAYCFGMVGYHMLIFSSGIEKIPQEYFEASTIDGATKPKQFFSITLPLLKGVFKTNIIMWTITSAGFFVWSRLFSTVTDDLNTITPMVYMYSQVFGGANVVLERNAGLGAAIGVILAIIVVVVFLVATYAIKDDDLEF